MALCWLMCVTGRQRCGNAACLQISLYSLKLASVEDHTGGRFCNRGKDTLLHICESVLLLCGKNASCAEMGSYHPARAPGRSRAFGLVLARAILCSRHFCLSMSSSLPQSRVARVVKFFLLVGLSLLIKGAETWDCDDRVGWSYTSRTSQPRRKRDST